MVTCFLPCRKGSERIVRKNIAPFAGYNHGLVEIKLSQLVNTSEINQIILSTNDEEIIQFAKTIKSKKLKVHRRDDQFASSTTSTDDLIRHVSSLFDNEHILWTHVTSPFVNSRMYSAIINEYWRRLDTGYDSLMTTTPLRTFLWSNGGPLNYDASIEKWPRTQTLEPLHIVNSAAFLAHSNIYRTRHDRIGSRPFLYELSSISSHDIDWPDEFMLAEAYIRHNLASVL